MKDKHSLEILEMIKTVLKKYNLNGIARQLYKKLWIINRNIIRPDKKIIKNYFNCIGLKKLHIGCGENIFDGWLNADLKPTVNNVIGINAAKKFPFDSESFDYVYSEHMIEHISYIQGQKMLKESFRVLRENGKIRISTPDLAFLVDLYRDDKSDVQNEYIEWATKKFISSAPCNMDTFVINNYVRDWGHTFIYDEKVLRHSLDQAGFKDITRCNINESKDKNLQYLENDTKEPKGFLKMETVTLEGIKKNTVC